jgi:hypothetical protein
MGDRSRLANRLSEEHTLSYRAKVQMKVMRKPQDTAGRELTGRQKRVRTRLLAAYLSAMVLLTASTMKAGDDEQSVDKQIRKITAMAADPSARAVVAQCVADFLKVPRMSLVDERRLTNLDYGTLFVAHEFGATGVSVMETASLLHTGKTLTEIGHDHHANWRQIGADAKKLNDHIETAFYDFFLHGPDPRRKSDDYDAAKDRVPADTAGLTKQEMDAARDTYARCYRRARGVDLPKDLPNPQEHTPPVGEGDPR